MTIPALRIGDERVLIQGRLQALIESRSNPGQFHICEIADNGRISCSCIGFTTRNAEGMHRYLCRHAATIEGWLAGRIPATIEETS